MDNYCYKMYIWKKKIRNLFLQLNLIGLASQMICPLYVAHRLFLSFFLLYLLLHCIDLYLYIYWPLACEEGYFGTNCSRVCSPNCKPDICRHTDGSCTSCTAGWTGYNCTTGNAITDKSIFYTFLLKVLPKK